MTPDQREQLRISLLRFLDANPTKFGVTTGLLTQMARSEGRSALTSEEVIREMEYLSDKGLVVCPGRVLSPELRTYRLHATGRDYLAQYETP